MEYSPRLVDSLLGQLLPILPAISLEGAKGVGKTATATRWAADVFSLDRQATNIAIAADPELILSGRPPVFIDEWQLVPNLWDVVRRAVDDGAAPGQFLLAGSALPPSKARIHSGAGRIVSLLMRPMCFPERQLESPVVSFGDLLSGSKPSFNGKSHLRLENYVDEILVSGFPGVRNASVAARPRLLSSYIDRIVDRDAPESGINVRRPEALRAWLAAYAAAISTTASYNSILDAATPGEANKPSRLTSEIYREVLKRIWVLDPLPAWSPSLSHLARLGQTPKHHLVDPALAARLLGSTKDSLIYGDGKQLVRRDSTFLGSLFESLVVQTVRVLAEQNGARVSHLRTHRGEHEVDIIVEKDDLSILAVEVKLGATVDPKDVAHLNWLHDKLEDRVIDRLIINTGEFAYRQKDGVGVIPLGLIGA